MAKYSHTQLIELIGICQRYYDGKIILSEALKLAEAAVPTYPAENLKGEFSRANKIFSGNGKFKRSYPANWAKAFLEVSENSPLVIQAFKQQQALYLQMNGSNNQKLNDILNSL